jgi:sulfur carrier protein ThiS
MKVRLKAYGYTRHYLEAQGGQAELEVDDGATVRDVLERLRIPIDRAPRVMVGSQLVLKDHVLQDGDEITLLSAIGGG